MARVYVLENGVYVDVETKEPMPEQELTWYDGSKFVTGTLEEYREFCDEL